MPVGDSVWSIAFDNGEAPPTPQASKALSAFDIAYTNLLSQLETAWSSGDDAILSSSARDMANLGKAATDVMRIVRPDGKGDYRTSLPRADSSDDDNTG